MKQKKCKNKSCGVKFTPFNSMQKACSPKCALNMVQEKKAKDEKKQANADRKKLRESDRSWWLKEAQKAFNKWVRQRDELEPCISCGRHHRGQYHAGHYRTVGANPELRFEPLNCHKQCSACNNHKSGNVVEYRINLVSKIGEKDLLWLEGPHEPKHYTIPDLREIRDKYKALCKEENSRQSQP